MLRGMEGAGRDVLWATRRLALCSMAHMDIAVKLLQTWGGSVHEETPPC